MRYVQNVEVLGASLGADEVALLSVARGIYYGLNSPAARVWQLLQAPKSLDEICTIMLAEFEVGYDTCRRDIAGLLADMLDEGLIKEASAS